MSAPRDRDRLEALETILDELRERDPGVAIIVEGDRDVAALTALGVPPPIVKINQGISLLNLCEDLIRTHRSFIILTDWDRKGGQLARHLERHFQASGVNIDVTTRRRLRRALPYQIHDIESLDGHVNRLRAAVRIVAGRP